MEPLLNVSGEEYHEEHNKPHLVYRHERRRNTLHPDEPCAASGNRQPNSFSCNHSLSEVDFQIPTSSLPVHTYLNHGH